MAPSQNQASFFLSSSVISASETARSEFNFLSTSFSSDSTDSHLTPNVSSPPHVIPYPPSNGDLLECYVLRRSMPGMPAFSEEALAFRYFDSSTSRHEEKWAVSFVFRPVQRSKYPFQFEDPADDGAAAGIDLSGKGKVFVEVYRAPFEKDNGESPPAANVSPFDRDVWDSSDYLGPATGSVYSNFVTDSLLFQQEDFENDAGPLSSIQNFIPFQLTKDADTADKFLDQRKNGVGKCSFDFVDFSLSKMAGYDVLFRPAIPVPRAPSTYLVLSASEPEPYATTVDNVNGDLFFEEFFECAKTSDLATDCIKTAAAKGEGSAFAYVKHTSTTYFKISLQQPQFAIEKLDELLPIQIPSVVPGGSGDAVDYTIFSLILGGFLFGVYLFFVKVGLVPEPLWLLKLCDGSINENMSYEFISDQPPRRVNMIGGGRENGDEYEMANLTGSDGSDEDEPKLQKRRPSFPDEPSMSETDRHSPTPPLNSPTAGMKGANDDYHRMDYLPASRSPTAQPYNGSKPRLDDTV